MSNDIPVVILCGGYGTRMKEETEFKPKPLMQIGGKPMLWHIMKIYAKHGYKKFILPLGYKGWMIKQYFLDYPYINDDISVTLDGDDRYIRLIKKRDQIDFTIELIDTGIETQTGSRLKRLEDRLPDTFMLTYGDGVSDINIDELVEFHRSHGKIITVTGVKEPFRFGDITHENYVVSSFSEKDGVGPKIVNGGFYVINKEFLHMIDDGDGCKLEYEPLQRATQKKELMVYIHNGRWICADLLRELDHLNDLYKKGDAFWLK